MYPLFRIGALCCLLTYLLLASCQIREQSGVSLYPSPGSEFAAYWSAGETEVNTYGLEHVYRDEMKQGEAILVFSTEAFSKSKQIKLDFPEEAGSDRLSVFKFRHIRRFAADVYEHSLMASLFTPVNTYEFPHTLKATASIQDWEGNSFYQLNLKGDQYNLSSYSHLEKEGDRIRKIDAVLLEDELWSILRMNPQSIKAGNINLIPALFCSQQQQVPLKPRKARVRFEHQGAMKRLVVEYLHLDRTLSIAFEPEFPNRILGWTEQDGGKITSKGTLRKSFKSANWQEKHHEVVQFRDSFLLR